MGYAFTFHVVKWMGGIPVGAYVHYPTINTDMLNRVVSRKKWHTNSDTISSSTILSRGKEWYYRIFMYFYAISLRTASFIMANGTWTKNHVDAILQHNDRFGAVISWLPSRIIELSGARHRPPKEARVVYPPCDTREMAKFPLEGRERVIVSVAQFRYALLPGNTLYNL